MRTSGTDYLEKIDLREKEKGVDVLLKMSGKTRLVARLLSKLFMSLAIGSITILSLMFIKYKFVYAVKVNSEDVGYVASKLALEKSRKNET